MIDNFDELVSRCNARRRRRMIRLSLLITGTTVLLIASIAGYDLWISKTSNKPIAAKAPSSAVSVDSPSVAVPEQTPLAEIKTTQNNIAPQPTESSEKNRDMFKDANDEQAARVQAGTAVSSNRSAEAVKTARPTTVETADTAPIAPTLKEQPASNSLFKVDSPSRSLPADPLKAYESDPKYETALAVARNFYDKNEFAEAAKWAKKANQLNREAEEAWLLYAKSYYAQGRKNEAIGVLELYLNYKDSKAANELLRSWKRQ